MVIIGDQHCRLYFKHFKHTSSTHTSQHLINRTLERIQTQSLFKTGTKFVSEHQNDGQEQTLTFL
jgi:hypothetical protein